MEPLGVGVFGHFLIAHGHFLKSFDCSGSLFAARWLSLVVIGGFSCSEGMWHLRSPTRSGTHVPYIGRQIPNHWTARELPFMIFNPSSLDMA